LTPTTYLNKTHFIFLPTAESPDQTIWFVEVQFQQDSQFYQRFFSEIYLYLGLYPETVDWQAVVFTALSDLEAWFTALG
jgi:predicted transposase YdaD